MSVPGAPLQPAPRSGGVYASLAAPETAALLPIYAIAIFTSALLAFWIQPLFTKLVLPRYGGSPAVWTTAAMFFQVVLLAGYLYAHLLTRRSLRTQLALHAIVVAAALCALPVHVFTEMPRETAPVLSLLAVMLLSVGLPFFAVSATAPLLQQWFSRTTHTQAGDPYFLYSASNAGSVLALIAYPLLLEPLLGLKTQTLAWSVVCGLFAAMLVVCGASVWRHRAGAHTAPPADISDAPALWHARARWIVLAFAPSSLLLGVTQHITSEIAAAPLLWLIPLTLYILTFVLAFARTQLVSPALINRIQPLLVILLVLVWPLNNHTAVLVLHLVVFAVTAMMCHGELARTRPPVQHLTDFYLCLAIGGAAGGVFNALIAPVVFDSVLEYPLALALACALRKPPVGARARWRDALPPIALALGYTALLAASFRPFAHAAWIVVVYLQVVGVTLYLTHRNPPQFALALLTVMIATPYVHSAERILERERSFFGVHTVLVDDTGKFHVLMHGITVHGAEYIAPEKRLKPTTYFHVDSPIGQVFSALGSNGGLQRVAVIGMGAGTLACYRAPGRAWTFYEIDPVVVRIAQDARYFDFLGKCAPSAAIVLGDGRLSIARAPDHAYDLIVIDTFSSDAIPAHMITREALALYLEKLSARGVVMFHVTNQYLDLVPVVSRLAADARVAALMPGPRLEIQFDERLAALPSSWIAISRDPARLQPLVTEEGWTPVPAAPGQLWTDDFSNLISALK